MKRVILIILALVATIGLFAACDSAAMVASTNISTAADQFQIFRRVVFYNGVTGQYILEVEGYCSVQPDPTLHQVAITIKVGPNEYIKHFFGLSDNTAWFAQQLLPAEASDSRYRVIFKPSEIIPYVDSSTGNGALIKK